MRKALGMTLAIALTVGFTLPAAAGQAKGTVKSVDAADHSFVLEDGTQLWLSDQHIADMAPGDKVLATYQTQGGKNVVVEFERRTMSPDGQETTNLGGTSDMDEEIEAPSE